MEGEESNSPILYEEENKLDQFYNNYEQMILGVYSEAMKSGQSLEALDNMDFLYFLDILIYEKYSTNKSNAEEVYGDTISL